jgi:hypothetical protein
MLILRHEVRAGKRARGIVAVPTASQRRLVKPARPEGIVSRLDRGAELAPDGG